MFDLLGDQVDTVSFILTPKLALWQKDEALYGIQIMRGSHFRRANRHYIIKYVPKNPSFEKGGPFHLLWGLFWAIVNGCYAIKMTVFFFLFVEKIVKMRKNCVNLANYDTWCPGIFFRRKSFCYNLSRCKLSVTKLSLFYLSDAI